jgi:hypothetical protein
MPDNPLTDLLGEIVTAKLKPDHHSMALFKRLRYGAIDKMEVVKF